MKIQRKQLLLIALLIGLITTTLEAQTIWEKEFPSGVISNYDTSVALGPNGTAYMASGTNYHGGTVAIRMKLGIYDAASGALLKQNLFSINADELVVTDLAVNSQGDAYVVGTAYDFFSTGIDDAVVVKFNRLAKVIWSIRIPNCNGLAVELDSQGNILVGADTIRKYDPNGNLIWSNGYSSPNGSTNMLARALKLDGGNGVYVFGFSENATDFSLFLAKLDRTTGNQIWTRSIGGGIPFSNYNLMYSSAFTIGGNNVYVAGPAGSGLLTAKISLSGSIIWQSTYPSTQLASGIAFYKDPFSRNSEYVSVAAQEGNNVAVIQYDAPSGFQRWSALYPGTTEGNYPYNPNAGAAFDGCGNFLIPVQDSGYMTALLSFDLYGNPQLDSTQSLLYAAHGLAVDSSGRIYVGSIGFGLRMAIAVFPPRQC